MRVGRLLSLLGGLGILLWPTLGRACDAQLTESEELGLTVWLVTMMGCVVSLGIAGLSRLLAKPRTRATIYRALGLMNLFGWVATVATCQAAKHPPQMVLVLLPQLLVGCGLWLAGSRSRRPRPAVQPGPV